jgi:hypothetical protein
VRAICGQRRRPNQRIRPFLRSKAEAIDANSVEDILRVIRVKPCCFAIHPTAMKLRRIEALR